MLTATFEYMSRFRTVASISFVAISLSCSRRRLAHTLPSQLDNPKTMAPPIVTDPSIATATDMISFIWYHLLALDHMLQDRRPQPRRHSGPAALPDQSRACPGTCLLCARSAKENRRASSSCLRAAVVTRSLTVRRLLIGPGCAKASAGRESESASIPTSRDSGPKASFMLLIRPEKVSLEVEKTAKRTFCPPNRVFGTIAETCWSCKAKMGRGRAVPLRGRILREGKSGDRQALGKAGTGTPRPGALRKSLSPFFLSQSPFFLTVAVPSRRADWGGCRQFRGGWTDTVGGFGRLL